MSGRVNRLFIIPFAVLLISGAIVPTTGVAAQEASGFPLGALAAHCQPGYGYPFTDCSPWDGITVTFASADGAFSETCVTTSNGGTTSGCSIDAPFGSTITAFIDAASIPAGYRLEGAVAQTFDIPDGPPQGEFAGPVFVLLPGNGNSAASGEVPPGTFALTANTAFCEAGYFGPFKGCAPWEGVTVTYATPNGRFNETCVTSGSGGRTASCTVNVPVITTIIASIDPASIPVGYVLEGESSLTFEIPRSTDGEFSGPAFVLLPAADATPVTGFPLGALTAFCDPGYAYPFAGCSPWDGATISFVATDGSFSGTCTTSSSGGTTSGCGVQVPFGSTIVATIDLGLIPDGSMLEGESTQTFEIPDGPPEGEFAGPVFVLLPDTRGDIFYPSPIVDTPALPLLANAAYCEPGYAGPFVGCTPWNDLVVTYASADGTFHETCTTGSTDGARAASCSVPVPVLATITASIDPGDIPDGYALEGELSQTFEIPLGVAEGQFSGPSFVLLPDDADDGSEGIGIVTQLPVTGAGINTDAASPAVVMLVAAAIIGSAGAITARRQG